MLAGPTAPRAAQAEQGRHALSAPRLPTGRPDRQPASALPAAAGHAGAGCAGLSARPSVCIANASLGLCGLMDARRVFKKGLAPLPQWHTCCPPALRVRSARWGSGSPRSVPRHEESFYTRPRPARYIHLSRECTTGRWALRIQCLLVENPFSFLFCLGGMST